MIVDPGPSLLSAGVTCFRRGDLLRVDPQWWHGSPPRVLGGPSVLASLLRYFPLTFSIPYRLNKTEVLSRWK